VANTVKTAPIRCVRQSRAQNRAPVSIKRKSSKHP